MMRTLIGLTLLALLPAVAMAQPVAGCVPTPAVAAHGYPGPRYIPTSNDLTRPTGKAVAVSDGQRLVVQGRVLDNRCMPIIGAVVELWQANPYGKWRLIGADERANAGSAFASAGRTYTSNDGSFQFITLFPGVAEKNAAPHLHIKVVADGIKPLTTALYFGNDNRNAADPSLKRLPAAQRGRLEMAMQPLSGDVNAGFLGSIELVLAGRSVYRTY